MAVYVDDACIPVGRMRMSHMIADSTEELSRMAKRIGVSRRWIQKAGTHQEHFDICMSKRTLAIEYGAESVSQKQLGRMLCNRKGEVHENRTGQS